MEILRVGIKRRVILKGTIASGAIGLSLTSGLITPNMAFAASWPANVFNKTNLNDALSSLGVRELAITNDILIKAPDLAEHGAVVPITVETAIPAIEKISLLVDKNPNPLVSTFELTQKCRGYISTRIKMKESSNIIAVVQAGGKFYSNRKVVDVAIGGCDE